MSSSSSSSSNVGFIGLGIMGEGMAKRLLTQGIAGTAERPLVVWNRTPSKTEALVQEYEDKTIVTASTARAVVESCGITFSMLSTPEASRAVFEGDDGVLAGIGQGKAIVDCATLAESDMQYMNDAIVAKGGRFLEAPVSGSKVPAAMGQLIFLCAGDQALFQEVRDSAFAAMGKASHFFGSQAGRGTRAKLVVNSIMGTMLAAFSEGINLSETMGLDGETMLQVIGQGAIQSPMFGLKGPKMLQGDFGPHFPLKHAHKDMKLASDMAKEAGVEFSVMDTAEELYRGALAEHGDEDFAAVYKQVQETKKE